MMDVYTAVILYSAVTFLRVSKNKKKTENVSLQSK